MFSLTVPGNLLLFGEYFVLEPGGLGLAIAPNVRAHLRAEPIHEKRSGLIILEGRMDHHGPGESWFLDTCSTDPLDDSVPVLLHSVWKILKYPPIDQGWRITLDTREFTYPDGRKRGLGSSAAAAVALTAALMNLSGHREGSNPQVVFPYALAAHRHFQGGRGSGYDIAASCFGGIGLFTGGPEPTWQSLDLPWLPTINTYAGMEQISTRGSIIGYQRWRSGHNSQLQAALEENNLHIRALGSALTWFQAKEHAETLASLGIEIGRHIGKPAEMPPPTRPHLFYKASGAGNELGFYLPDRGQAAEATQSTEATETTKNFEPDGAPEIAGSHRNPDPDPQTRMGTTSHPERSDGLNNGTLSPSSQGLSWT
jgi:phosphomevalonate kinase